MPKIFLSERIKKPPRFFTIEPYLREQDEPIASCPEARDPRIVPLVIMDYGSVRSRLKQMRYKGLKEYLICIKYCPFSYADYDKLRAKIEANQ